MRLQVESYRVPPGYLDYPFIYIFDATGLTNGANVNNLVVPIQGDSDFILRRITGLRTVISTTGRFLYRNASGSQAMSAQVFTPGNTRGVLPEKLYPYNSQIGFDLTAIAKQTTACDPTIFTSYLAFQGVKRFPMQQGYPLGRTSYKYREMRWGWPQTIALSTFAGSVPVTFIQQIDNYDYELQRIAVTHADGTALTTADFRIILYDPNGHQMSNLPVNIDFINAANARWPTQKSIFPAPSIVYPAGSMIRFEIFSDLCAAGGAQSYDLLLDGIQRLPC